MGVYDLPIIIDKMIVETGREKVFFIGHSLGGLVYSAGVAELPYLNDKIQASFLLSPANLLYGATTPLRLVTLLVDLKPWMQVNTLIYDYNFSPLFYLIADTCYEKLFIL